MEQTLPRIYLVIHLLPTVRQIDAQTLDTAKDLWSFYMMASRDHNRTSILEGLKMLVREILVNTSIIPTPDQLLRALDARDQWTNIVDILSFVFPSESDLDDMLEALPSTPLDPSLAIQDPLIPPASEYEPQEDSTDQQYDTEGFSRYSRVVNALLSRLVEDRQAAREHSWALKHILALALYAQEAALTTHTGNPVFADNISIPSLQRIVNRAQQVTAYLCSVASVEAGWSEKVVNAVLVGGKTTLDPVGNVVYNLIKQSERKDRIRESRILRDILQHIFKDISKTEADQWFGVARRLEKTAPQMSLAITWCISNTSLEPPRLERYRNELAAGMLGVSPSKANTEGLSLLRKLAITAPDPDSDVVFLPQLRAVNLVKACQQWIMSDEDLNESVESEMTLVFVYLAPILQNVTGSHWDFIFDIMENNLEIASFNDSSTLVALYRTLLLVLAVEDLASTNKSLRAIWEERQSTVMMPICNLVMTKLESSRRNTPLSICREMALRIVQDLPESLITREFLPKMCHVLQDTSPVVQRTTYQVLQEAAKKYTEHMVIEAAVETEPTVKPEMPEELMILLQRKINQEDNSEQADQNVFGYFLAWMVVFDLFAGASLKVKMGYTDQLREGNLISDHFLPHVFHVLNLYDGRAKAFKLDIWTVDEYYLDMYSQDAFLSIQLLSAHLYYRALLVVPSLFRNWLLDCRDRQLYGTVSSYTSTYFSPVIIKEELARTKDAISGPDLVEENLTVKIAAAVNEVTESYAIDEQHLQLTLKLPSDWPLHVVEVKDAKPVGVSEERWRAWVLGVQQILAFRNGTLVDGLVFFKKNVISHFQGVAECAICYSIISATDGSLPRKPCNTCKNRYHAGCLYKWFNTSHSSSCPLCRSEINL